MPEHTDLSGSQAGITRLEEPEYLRNKYPESKRTDMKDSDFCGPDKSFPILDAEDVIHASQRLHNASGSQSSIKKCVIGKAHANGWKLPETWTDGDSEKEDRMDTSTPIETPELEPIPEQVAEETPTPPEQETEVERRDMPTHTALYAPIIRIDKAKREVECAATSEALDTYKTVFSYDGSKEAFKKWIERTANVREMHDKKAVGKGVGVRFDDENQQVIVRTRVSKSADGDNTWTKIEEGILTGYSVGATNPVWGTIERNGKKYPYLLSYDLTELSLVDSPSNPDAAGLVICRADGLTEVVDITEPEPEQQQTPSSQVIVSSPFTSSDVPGSASDLERAGARISSGSKSALHDARNTAMKSAMGLMGHCACDECSRAKLALDPDNDGDIDFMSLDDPDGDAESVMANRSQQAALKQVEATIEEIIERVLTEKTASFIQRQNSILTRFASIDIPVPEMPEVHFDPELIRSVVSAEISSLVTPLEERLTTALESLNTSSSLSEVRSVLTEVKETVERIASQPAAGGPILNGGHPIDKRLANQPYTSANAQIDPRTFWDEAQKRGLLTTPELQMQAAAATAIPMQVRRS